MTSAELGTMFHNALWETVNAVNWLCQILTQQTKLYNLPTFLLLSLFCLKTHRHIQRKNSLAKFTEGFYTATIQRGDICFTHGQESQFIEQLFPKQKPSRVHIKC